MSLKSMFTSLSV